MLGTNLIRRGLGVVRKVAHSRTIIMTTDASRGGNLLYTWAWAHTESIAGRPTFVLENSHAGAWLNEFPLLRALTCSRSDMKLLDSRHVEALYYYDDPLGHDFLVDFVQKRLLPSPAFSSRIERARVAMGDDALVINVRRGDYYSNPAFTERYGLDIERHVREALGLLGYSPQERPSSFVISDDVDWCRRHLGHLALLQTVFPGHPHNMFDDLAALASARHLVLANSTFSYWGQFISRGLNGNQRAIAAAAHEYDPHHQTMVGALLDPAWLATSVWPGQSPRAN